MITTYYWKGRPNFGDLLGPLLLQKFAKLRAEWIAEPKDADIILVGSLLDKIPSDYKGIIAGAGKLHEETKLSFPNAQILGVRGPLTARGLKGNFILADPALLSDHLVPLRDKQYNLGLVPHWSDTELEHDKRFLKFDPKIIRVKDDPLKVITEIGLCKKIVSSSLHGIIVADAFNIPRRIEMAPWMLSRPKQEGGTFKWLDYSASIGVELQIGITQEIDRHKILEKQYDLYEMFEEIKKVFRGA